MTLYDALWTLATELAWWSFNHPDRMVGLAFVVFVIRWFWTGGLIAGAFPELNRDRHVTVKCRYCGKYIATRPLSDIGLDVCFACTKKRDEERSRKRIRGRPIDVIAGVKEIVGVMSSNRPSRRPTPKPMPSRDWLPPIINAVSGMARGRGGGNAAHNHGLVAPPAYDSPYRGDAATRALLCDTGSHLSIVNGDPLMRCGICGLPRAEWDKLPPPPDEPLESDPSWSDRPPEPLSIKMTCGDLLRALRLPGRDYEGKPEYDRWKPWFDGGWPVCGQCGKTLGVLNGKTYNYCFKCEKAVYPCCPACGCPCGDKETPLGKLEFSGVLQRSHYGDPLCRLCQALDMLHPHNDRGDPWRCPKCHEPHNAHIACDACRKCGHTHGPRVPCVRADIRLDNWVTKV